jgi:hypothetical protein
VFSGDYAFAALEYTGRRMIETWYDRDGAALYVLIRESGSRTLIPAAPPGGETAAPGPAVPPGGETAEPAVTEAAETEAEPEAAGSLETRYFYTNEGRLSGVEGPGGTAAALYNIRGMPRYLETSVNPGGPAPAAYTWQWDEAGRLVRLSGREADNPLDYRYEYTLDSRGNWTERREFALVPLDSSRIRGSPGEGAPLVPRTVRAVRRIIRYETALGGPGTEKEPPGRRAGEN